MKVKGFSWVGVGTDDYERSLRFFTDLMGLEVAASGDRQAILHVGDGGQQLEIFGRDGPGKALNSPPTVAFEVDDVAAAREELLAAGVELIGDIGTWNGFEWLYFRSPDGHIFEVKKTPPAGWDKNRTPPPRTSGTVRDRPTEAGATRTAAAQAPRCCSRRLVRGRRWPMQTFTCRADCALETAPLVSRFRSATDSRDTQ